MHQTLSNFVCSPPTLSHLDLGKGGTKLPEQNQ